MDGENNLDASVAAETPRIDEPQNGAADAPRTEEPIAAETPRTEEPIAAETPRTEEPIAAETPRYTNPAPTAYADRETVGSLGVAYREVGDTLAPDARAWRSARATAAARRLMEADLSQMTDAQCRGLFAATTEAAFNITDTTGRASFGKRASDDPRANIELLRRFFKGEYELMESDEVKAWKTMDEEQRFRHAMDAESKTNKLNSFMKSERGPGFWEWATAALVASANPMVAGAPRDTTALEEVAKKSDYENMTPEEQAKYRADVIADYERKMAKENPVAFYLSAVQNLSDRGGMLLADAYNSGRVDTEQMMRLPKDERDNVLAALSVMRGDQTKGRLLGVQTDFTDANGEVTAWDRVQLALYGFQQSILGIPKELAETGESIGGWIYAKTLSDEAERKAFMERWELEKAAQRSLEQPLPEAETWFGAGLQGVAENVHWFLAYAPLHKGKALVAGAKEAAKSAKAADAAVSAAKAEKSLVESGIAILNKAGAAVEDADAARYAQMYARQMASLERVTHNIRAKTKALADFRKVAKGDMVKGGLAKGAGDILTTAPFFNEYVEAADAAGVSREDSVPMAFLVGSVNALVENLYVPGLSEAEAAGTNPALVKKLMIGSLVSSLRKREYSMAAAWMRNNLIAAAKGVATVGVTETIEENLQQLTTEHAVEFQKQLRENGLSDALVSLIPSAKDWVTMVDTTSQVLPTSLGFGLTSPIHAQIAQGRANYNQRKANAKAGYTHTMRQAMDTYFRGSPVFDNAGKPMDMAEAFRTAKDYDMGVVDMIAKSIKSRQAVQRYWEQNNATYPEQNRDTFADPDAESNDVWIPLDEKARQNHAYMNALTRARRAYAENPSVEAVADAMQIDSRTAEVVVDMLADEREAAAFSPQFASMNAAFNTTAGDLSEQNIASVMPGYVPHSFRHDRENSKFVAQLTFPNGEKKTLAFAYGSMAREMAKDWDAAKENNSEFGKSYDAMLDESGDTETPKWNDLGLDRRRGVFFLQQNGKAAGTAGLFEFEDEEGKTITVPADDIIFLADGNLADVGYRGSGPVATMATVRHEVWHSVWRMSKQLLSEDERKSLANAIDIDISKDGWKIDFDEKVARQLERYASGEYVSQTFESKFAKILDKGLSKTLSALNRLVGEQKITDAQGKEFTLKSFYDAYLRGELTAGKIPVVAPKETSETRKGKLGNEIPADVTDAEREAADNALRGETAAQPTATERGTSAAPTAAERGTSAAQPTATERGTSAAQPTATERGTSAAPAQTATQPAQTAQQAAQTEQEPKEGDSEDNPADWDDQTAQYIRVGIPNKKDNLIVKIEVRSASKGLFASTDEGYSNPDLQNRDTEKVESTEKIESIATDLKALIMQAPQSLADRNIPFVDATDSVVIGNHRVLATRMAYERGLMNEPYKPGSKKSIVDFIREKAAKRGIEIPDGIEDPIIVGRIVRIESVEKDKDMVQVAEEANESDTRPLGKDEKAFRHANILIKNNILQKLKFRADGSVNPNAGDKSNAALSLFASLTHAQDFWKNGTLSEDAQETIVNAALAAFLGKNEQSMTLMRKLVLNEKALGLQNIMRALAINSPDLADLGNKKPQFDIRGAVAEALGMVAEWKEKYENDRVEAGKTRQQWRKTHDPVKSWNEHKAQGDMFRTPTESAAVLADLFAAAEAERSFDKEDNESDAGKVRAVRLIAGYLEDYAANARAVNTEGADMFGEAPATMADVLRVQREKPRPDGSPRFSVETMNAWPENFPNVTVQTTRDFITRKHNDLFVKAKAGDIDAANELVAAVAKPQKIRELLAAHPNAKIVTPVYAEERTGKNKIPAAYAKYIAKLGGIKVSDTIIQSVRAFHTGADAFDRLSRRASFEGQVESGAEYIICDDHVTMGGTLNELRTFIENNGGKFVAATCLTASKGSSILAIRQNTIDELKRKFGADLDENLRKANIAGRAEALTESEGRYILKLSPDTFRDRCAQAGTEKGPRNQRQVFPAAPEIAQGLKRQGIANAENAAAEIVKETNRLERFVQAELNFEPQGPQESDFDLEKRVFRTVAAGTNEATEEEVAQLLSNGVPVRNIYRELYKPNGLTWPVTGMKVTSVEDFASLCTMIRSPFNEMFKVVSLDENGIVLDAKIIAIGTIDGVNVHPRDVAAAFAKGAKKIVFSHNHPSGNPQPSRADVQLQEHVEKVCRLMGIKCLDHIITNGDSCYSMRGFGDTLKVGIHKIAPKTQPWEAILGNKTTQMTSPESFAATAATLRKHSDSSYLVSLNTKNNISAIHQFNRYEEAVKILSDYPARSFLIYSRNRLSDLDIRNLADMSKVMGQNLIDAIFDGSDGEIKSSYRTKPQLFDSAVPATSIMENPRFSVAPVAGKMMPVTAHNLTLQESKDLTKVADLLAPFVGTEITNIETGKPVAVNDTSVEEFLHSNYSEQIRAKKKSVWLAKARAAGILDEMIATSPGGTEEAPKHNAKLKYFRAPTHFGIANWDGVRVYPCEIIYAETPSGKRYFYDIVNILRPSFTAKHALEQNTLQLFYDRGPGGSWVLKTPNSISNAGGAVNGAAAVRFSILGEQGAARLDDAEKVIANLQVAKDALGQRKWSDLAKDEKKKIRLATGWEMGADGKWRYEVPDGKFDIDWLRSENFNYLADIFDMPELYKIYPWLNDTEVRIDERDLSGGRLGAYSPSYNMIVLSTGIKEFLQDKKLFDRKEYLDYRNERKRLIDEENSLVEKLREKNIVTPDEIDEGWENNKDIYNRICEFIVAREKLDKKFRESELGKKFNELYISEDFIDAKKSAIEKRTRSVLIHEIQHAIQHEEGFAKGGSPAVDGFEDYLKQAGEVESRNAEKRIGMTDEERRNTLLEETEDVARENQIYWKERDGAYAKLASAMSQPSQWSQSSQPFPSRYSVAMRTDGTPYQTDDFFTPPAGGSLDIPVASLRTLKNEPQKSIDNAANFMRQAAAGNGAKRKPISVVDNGDGTYTVADGNATTWALATVFGVKNARVNVVGTNTGTRLGNSAYLVENDNSGCDADGNLRAAGDAADRDGIYAAAVENTDALREICDKAAKKANAKVMMRPGPKKLARIDEKVKADYAGDYRRCVDIIGGTLVMPDTSDFTDAIKGIRKNLPEGASIAKVKKLNFKPNAKGYQDIKVSVRFANGAIGEIIIVSEYMNDAKFNRGGHEVYEIERTLDKYGKLENRIINDALKSFRDLTFAIYERGTQATTAENFERIKAFASSSLTLLLLPDNATSLSSQDINLLKSLSSESQAAKPPSVSSYAMPASSFIENINGISLENKGNISYSGDNVNGENQKSLYSVAPISAPLIAARARDERRYEDFRRRPARRIPDSGRRRFSIAYPQINRMSAEELVAAAEGALIAGRKSGGGQALINAKRMQNALAKLHPEWNQEQAMRAAYLLIPEARKIARSIRGDLEKGVRESTVLKYLPQTVQANFSDEMLAQARAGHRAGAYWQKAENAIAKRQERTVADAVKAQTGIDTAVMETTFGARDSGRRDASNPRILYQKQDTLCYIK